MVHSAKTLAIKELADRELCRKHLLPFVIKNNTNYQAGWFHTELCAKLEYFEQEVLAKRSPRMIVTVPPRGGKSEIISRCFPSWVIGRNHEIQIINATYSSLLSNSFSREVRDIIKQEYFKELFNVTLKSDEQSVVHWKTNTKAQLLSSSVGTPLTGFGANFAIIDDYVKNREEANSQLQRDLVYNWYTSTLYTRLMPGGGIIIVATRWHHDDLIGRLIEIDKAADSKYKENWIVLNYPAIATKDEQHRKKGEALHPERYDIKSLLRIKNNIGEADFEALYQQNPTNESGAVFKKDMFKFYDTGELPKKENLRFYCAWDLAVSIKETNNYTAGITVAVDEDDTIWIVDVFRDKVEASELVENMIDLWEIYRPEIIKVEEGVIKYAIEPFLRKRMSERQATSMNVEPISAGRADKLTRARSIQGRMRQGKVLFPRDALFTQALMNELLQFPQSRHDDQVDALAYIGLMLDDMNPATSKRKKTSAEKWRDRLRKYNKTSGYMTS